MDDGRGRVSAGNKRNRGEEGRAAEPPPAGADDAAAFGPVTAEQMQRELAALRQEMRTQRAESNARVTESNARVTHLEEELQSQTAAFYSRAHRLQEEAINNLRWVVARAVPNSAMHLPEPTLAWADSPMAVLTAGVMAKIMDSLGPCAKQRITAGLVCKAFKEACSGPATVYRFGEYKELGRIVTAVATSPAGGVFACACEPADDDAHTVLILALDSGREIRRMEFPGYVGRLAFNHDGTQILASWHSHTQIRRVEDGSLLATIDGNLADASFAGVSSEFVTATLDDGDDREVSLGRWSSSTGQHLNQNIPIGLPGWYINGWTVNVKPAGRRLVAYEYGVPDQPALVYTVGVDTVVKAWRLPAADEKWFITFSWSPDESRLFSCSSIQVRYDDDDRPEINCFQLWDAADGREIWRSDIKGRHNSVNHACWSPGGRQIYVSCADTESDAVSSPPSGMIIIDASSGELRRLNCGPTRPARISEIVCTADSRALLILAGDVMHFLDLGAETTAVNRL